MIGSDILEYAYSLVGKDSTTFLDGTTVTQYKRLNMLYGHRILDILRVRVDKNASIENATTTLVSTNGLAEGSVGYNGEYPFPADLLRPTRFEVSYDGITWTGLGTSTFSTAAYGITWTGTQFIAVGQGTNNIATSTDGITWTGITTTTIFSTQGLGVGWSGTYTGQKIGRAHV